MVIAKGWEKGEIGSSLMGIEFQFCKMKKLRSVAQQCECTYLYWTVLLKI